MLTGQLGQVHCPEGQLQVPEDEQPQSLMMKVVRELLFFSTLLRSVREGKSKVDIYFEFFCLERRT